MQQTSTTAHSNPDERPLAFILDNPDITEAIIQGMIAGRLETQNRFTTLTPKHHKGLFAFVVSNDTIGMQLLPLEWFQQLKRNQLRWTAPETLSHNLIRLVIMSGMLKGNYFRINHKGVATRELVDSQNEPADGGQLSLFGNPEQTQSLCQSIFVISQNETIMEDNVCRDILSIYLVYPGTLSKCGSKLEFDDYERLGRFDLNDFNTSVSSLPSGIKIEPTIEDIEDIDDNGHQIGLTG